MPNGYEKRTNVKKKLSVHVKQLKEELIKRISRIKPVTLFCFSIFVVVVFVIPFIRYLKHPCRIENVDKLASAAIEEMLGEGYKDNANLKRGQVIQIVYKVFHGLRLKGFEESKDAAAIISWSRDNNVLKGLPSGDLCLDELATKQDSFAFIARSLGILDETSTEEGPALDDTLFAWWARPEIEGLVTQKYLRNSDFDKLGQLRETITASELEEILNRIVELKTKYVSFGNFVWSFLSDAKLLTLVAWLSLGISLIGFFRDRKDKKELSKKEEEERANRTAIIYLAGIEGAGKSTLKQQMTTPGNLGYTLEGKQEPTKEHNGKNIELRSSNGNVLFVEAILDESGDSEKNILQFLEEADNQNKILLLVLAHTKKRKDFWKDQKFIKEQLEIINYFWMKIIPPYGKNLNKIVVFINKTDMLLFQKLSSARRRIYGKHIELLKAAAAATAVTLVVAEGNAIREKGLEELYGCLTSPS